MADVLVTGGAGFIGSNTVDLLIREGYSVSVVDNLSTGRRENLNPKAKFRKVDITSPRLDSAIKGDKPECVIHLAAQIDVRDSVRRPAYDSRVNVLGTLNLIESCRKNRVKKIVYSSSGGAVYGEPEYNPVDESHPIRPLSPYGASKYAAEKYVQMYGSTYGMDYNILRYGNVYGPRQDPLGEAGVVAIFTGLLAGGRRPTIFGDGRQTRDFCYVGDIASANVMALEREGKSKTYNVGSGAETSVNAVTNKLQDALGVNLKPIHGKPIPGEVRRICLDVRLIKKELRWRPKTSLESGLKSTVRWIRNA